MTFVHLHVHTHYSLLDGYSMFPKLIERVKDYDMSAVAITDHGTMYGVIEFYNACNRENVHPIIGMEGYITTGKMTSKDPQKDKRANHILLIAENIKGYKNLLKIASSSQLKGFYYQPRIDHDFLADHSEGLITTSGCLRGVIPDLINQGQFNQAEQWLKWYLDIFGRDNFFIELQDHEISDLKKVNVKLFEFGQKYQARFIATNDVHYVDRDDARYQDVLLAIQTGALLADTSRMKMDGDTYFLRSPDEMSELFSEVPESITNTQEIADRCDLDLARKKYHLPNFEVPQDCTDDSFLRDLCEKGLIKRYGEKADDPEVLERLEHELKVIHDMGFDAYFLIVWDLCKYARENNIWYEARGSAAGSIVAYALDITLIEPLSHGLLFERFLNPARVNMPDIDLDFQDDKRADVMQYCAQKYGSDQVAQIITFGKIKARQAIRDVGRVMDVPLNEVDKVAKLIPNIPSHPVSIRDALKEVPELRNYYENVPYLRELIDTAARMEGVVRNAGTHAAGVVISDKPLVEYVPLHRPTRETEESPINTITQYEMSVLDDLGMLKVDFLGLSTLTVMSNTCKMIQERHGIRFHLGNIPLDDAETFSFLGKGLTAGVFQLEGAGMTRYLVQMKPHNLDNIIAMVALYRPGPMQFIPSYIARMHGKEEISYRHELLRPILEETYGVAIYQEQIMSAAISLAGYTASEADKFRQIIAKKKENQIAPQKKKFIKGAIANGIDKQTAEIIFDDWKNFAQYGFNKSHAADYGVIAVQTAYLKTHYPLEFMTALLCGAMNDSDKVAFYIADCIAMGIEVHPPDVNESSWDFTIEEKEEKKPSIRFGLGAIKNVGQNPVEIIVEGRAGIPFEDLNDFVRKIDLRKVGRRALECFIRVGALDGFGERRAILTRLERMIAISESHFRAKEEGQLTFFGTVEGMKEEITLPDIKSLDSRENLVWEKELLGLYLTDHPLSLYINKIKKCVSHYSGQLKEVLSKQVVIVAGLVTNVRPYVTRKGDPMGFATIEDIQGSIDLVIFPRAWKKARELVEIDQVITVKGKIDNEAFDPKILVDEIKKLDLENSANDENEIGTEKRINTFVGESQKDMSINKKNDTETTIDNNINSYKNNIVEIDEEYSVNLAGNNFNQNFVSNSSADVASTTTQVTMIQERTLTKETTFINDLNNKKMTIIIQSSGKKENDIRLLRQIHGLLHSSPGNDRFTFICREQSGDIELEFPNDNVGITDELIDQIHQIVGMGNVFVS